jgi:hypothetical protein
MLQHSYTCYMRIFGCDIVSNLRLRNECNALVSYIS